MKGVVPGRPPSSTNVMKRIGLVGLVLVMIIVPLVRRHQRQARQARKIQADEAKLQQEVRDRQEMIANALEVG